jgi:predicted NAD/FAD-dependent oxidoreductase
MQECGMQVLILEKSRGVGGRMATRRFAGGVFDHGAQFFTVRKKRFETSVRDLIRNGVAVEWSRGFVGLDGVNKKDGHPRYRGIAGMSALPKHLATGLDIQLNTRVNRLELDQGEWLIAVEPGDGLRAKTLLMTPPIPQSIALLGDLFDEFPEAIKTTLVGIEYDRCLALLTILDHPSCVPAPGAVQIDAEPINWIADNHLKGISPDRYGLTIHAAPEFSQKKWAATEEVIADQMISAAQAWIKSEPGSYQLHRWRYSKPKRLHPKPFLYLENPASLVFAGDAFAGPRVEGAAISGISAGEFLGSIISP